MSQERIAFENWLGIKPCGAAHDLAWAAWQARASLSAPQQAKPEPVGEPVAWQRRDRNIVTGEWSEWHEDDDIEEELDPEWAERRPLFTHPAPGVPEVLIQQVMEALRDGLSVCESVQVSRDRKISREGCALYAQTEEWCRWLDAEVGPKIRAALDALAAAQAKGADPKDIAAAGVMLMGRRADHA